eukprot:6532054-Prymnesium_polylepis.1
MCIRDSVCVRFTTTQGPVWRCAFLCCGNAMEMAHSCVTHEQTGHGRYAVHRHRPGAGSQTARRRTVRPRRPADACTRSRRQTPACPPARACSTALMRAARQPFAHQRRHEPS